MHKIVRAALLAAIVIAPGWAQYPGQYPPGQYPPGQDPNNPNSRYPGQGPGGGISLPHRKKKAEKADPAKTEPDFKADGYVASNDPKKLVIKTNDGRTITITVTPQTVFTKGTTPLTSDKISQASQVHVECVEDDQSYLTALKVDLLKDPPPQIAQEGHAAANNPVVAVDPATAAELSKPAATDAPDRPILRRGHVKQRNSDDDTTETASAAPPPPPKPKPAAKPVEKKDSDDFTITADSPVKAAPGDDEMIIRTKEWAQTFNQGLPNFLCEQVTTRSYEQSRSAGWTAADIVTAKVLYDNGHEEYKDITVGGKRTNKSMMEIGGSTSTGEFASTLLSLLDGNRAQFKFYQTTHVGGEPAAIYDFKVTLQASDWTIIVGSQALMPAYSGSVWIDKASAQIRRIEMQADNVPKDFPDDSIQSAVDYEPVRLGSGMFLLPVHAENIACQRGSTICSKNEIDFRNYHKYSGESTIEYK